MSTFPCRTSLAFVIFCSSLLLSSFAAAQTGKKVGVGAYASVAAPREYQGGIQLRFADKIAFDTTYGFYPLKSGNLKGKLQGLHLNSKWFPWSQSLFLGISGNALLIDMQVSDSIDGEVNGVPTTIPYKLKFDTKSIYVRPNLGWDFTWKSGFLIGFDVGYDLPLTSTTRITSEFPEEFKSIQDQVEASPDYQDSKKETEDAIDAIIKEPRLSLTLLRLGWIF